MDSELNDILDKISIYIQKKHNNKKWEAGKDWVQYAGPYFNELEYLHQLQKYLLSHSCLMQ